MVTVKELDVEIKRMSKELYDIYNKKSKLMRQSKIKIDVEKLRQMEYYISMYDKYMKQFEGDDGN